MSSYLTGSKALDGFVFGHNSFCYSLGKNSSYGYGPEYWLGYLDHVWETYPRGTARVTLGTLHDVLRRRYVAYARIKCQQ